MLEAQHTTIFLTGVGFNTSSKNFNLLVNMERDFFFYE